MAHRGVLLAASLLVLCGSSLGARYRKAKARRASSSSCAQIGCFADYDRSRPCQCNSQCPSYGNCCSDFMSLCRGEGGASCASLGCQDRYNSSHACQCNPQCSTYGDCCSDYAATCSGSGPSPTPPAPSPTPTPTPTPLPFPTPSPTPGGDAYWSGVNMGSKAALHERLSTGVTRLSYSGLWTAYKSVWVSLPGQCQGKIFDVYSRKCWTPGTGQCGGYRAEGDCYNREHSWPKSWWGGGTNSAYSDMFHVVPSDGYVNGRRSNHPFGEVRNPTYTSSEGNKVGPCVTPGYSGTCFEPTDRVKGLMARNYFYMAVRYDGDFGCCEKAAVSESDMKAWTVDLLMRWNAAYPPEAWEVEFNNRAQGWQGNRNPFIDFPELAQDLFR